MEKTMAMSAACSATPGAGSAHAYAWTRMVGMLLCISAISGCAVMDKDDCQRADWFHLGRTDALHGQYRADQRAQACAEHGMAADTSAYRQGHRDGLRGFCTAASGQAHGNAGRSYQRGFCPAETEAAFLQGYNDAYAQYQFRQRVADLQRRIDSRQRDLGRELSRKPLDPKAVDRIRYDLRNLEHQLRTEMHMRALR